MEIMAMVHGWWTEEDIAIMAKQFQLDAPDGYDSFYDWSFVFADWRDEKVMANLESCLSKGPVARAVELRMRGEQ